MFGRAGIDLEDYLHVFAHVYIYIYMHTSRLLVKVNWRWIDSRSFSNNWRDLQAVQGPQMDVFSGFNVQGVEVEDSTVPRKTNCIQRTVGRIELFWKSTTEVLMFVFDCIHVAMRFCPSFPIICVPPVRAEPSAWFISGRKLESAWKPIAMLVCVVGLPMPVDTK